MNIILTKKEEVQDAKYPNNKEVGYMKIGKLIESPVVGKPFYVGYAFRTSKVMEIINEDTFKTQNSIYTFKEFKR